MCCSQAPFSQLCHWNIPVIYEEHEVSHFRLFQKSCYSPLFDNMLSLSSVPLLCPEIVCALCPIHHPRHLLLWLAPAWKCHLAVYCSKESLSFFFPLFSVTGGAVFKNVSLSLLRCSFALQPSHIGNCSYHHSEMLQSICWIHRIKSEQRKKVIWCGFQIGKKYMFLSVRLLIVIRILAHLYSNKYTDLYRNKYTGLLWMRKIISQIQFEPKNIFF